MRQVAPSNQPAGGPSQQARILAGRWIALQRLRLGLSSAQVAELAGIDPTTLLLLETGLADLAMASKESWMSLVGVLAGGDITATPVVAVIMVALGGTAAQAPGIMAQVVDDLGSIISRPSAGGAPGAEAQFTAGMREGATDRALVGLAPRSVASNWLYIELEVLESVRPAQPAGVAPALSGLKKPTVPG
jgi:hypothetical protein